MSLIRFSFQNNHGNQSSVEPYYSRQSGQANSDDTFFRGSHRSCSLKKVLLKKGKGLCRSLFFHKVASLRTEHLLEKRIRRSCFSVNLAKFLRTPFSLNTSEKLPLYFIEGRKTYSSL